MSSPRIGQTIPPQVNPTAAVEPVYVPELSADKISSGVLTSTIIEVGDEGVIKAGTGNISVELVKEGLFGYKDGVEIFRLANGELYLKGTIEATSGVFSGQIIGAEVLGSTLQGGSITIGSANAIFRASELGIQLGSGSWINAPFTVDATGKMMASNVVISGTVTGSKIVGSDITGSILRTTSVGQRVQVRQVPQDESSDIYAVGYGIVEFFTGVQAEPFSDGSRCYIQGTRLPGASGYPIFDMVAASGLGLSMFYEELPAGGYQTVIEFSADVVRVGSRVL